MVQEILGDIPLKFRGDKTGIFMEWIDVKTRFPTEKGEYAVLRNWLSDSIKASGRCIFNGIEFDNNEIGKACGEITHWMPLAPKDV
jgi:hypothetical protein